jgi:hypothetical protein
VPSAILTGLILQWLLDPATTPSGAEVVAGMRDLKP